jgi:hypothetical protein
LELADGSSARARARHSARSSSCKSDKGQACAAFAVRSPHGEVEATRWGGTVPARSRGSLSRPPARPPSRCCCRARAAPLAPPSGGPDTGPSTRLGCAASTRGATSTRTSARRGGAGPPGPEARSRPGARALRAHRGRRQGSPAGQLAARRAPAGAAGLRRLTGGGLRAVEPELALHSPGLTPSPAHRAAAWTAAARRA